MLPLLLMLGAFSVAGAQFPQPQDIEDDLHLVRVRQASPAITSTSSSVVPSETSFPAIAFHLVPSVTTCSSVLFSWDYVGPSGLTMSLNVTTSPPPSVPPSSSSSGPSSPLLLPPPSSLTSPPPSSTQVQPLPIKRQATNTSELDVQVASNLNPASGQYTWSVVTVPQGWYALEGTIGEDSTLSPMFLVSDGSDTSCLLVKTSSSSSSSLFCLSCPLPSSFPSSLIWDKDS
jgi:hypothetical protein